MKRFAPTRPVLLEEIDEAKAKKLHISSSISASVIIFVPRIENGIPEILLVDEWSLFDSDSKLKAPAGKILSGENFLDAAKRKLPIETGLKLLSAKFCFGGEFSSTTNQRHYKIFLLGDKVEGEVAWGGDGKISRKIWVSVEKLEGKINLAQQFGLHYMVEVAKTLNEEYGMAFMNSY
ncbi:MAG TPA: NUDIX hydrolase [Candidatus Paceibacterota bacterium]|nr:NUDIX hydrolase [Candidatus Paceibacterota bacterium]